MLVSTTLVVMNQEEKRKIYDKTGGHCAYCGNNLVFKNHGKNGTRGSWHIEHVIPKAKGGSNNIRNLKPSCAGCNLEKATKTGSNYKKEFEPKTIGGKVVKAIGAKRGSFGTSHKQVKRKPVKSKPVKRKKKNSK